MIGLRNDTGKDVTPRALHLSTVVGLAMLCALGVIWGIRAWIVVGERDEAIARADQTLAAVASAYGEYGSSLVQNDMTLPAMKRIRTTTRSRAQQCCAISAMRSTSPASPCRCVW